MTTVCVCEVLAQKTHRSLFITYSNCHFLGLRKTRHFIIIVSSNVWKLWCEVWLLKWSGADEGEWWQVWMIVKGSGLCLAYIQGCLILQNQHILTPRRHLWPCFKIFDGKIHSMLKSMPLTSRIKENIPI